MSLGFRDAFSRFLPLRLKITLPEDPEEVDGEPAFLAGRGRIMASCVKPMALEPIEAAGILFGVFSGGISLAILLARTFLWEKPKLKIEVVETGHYDQVHDSAQPEESKLTHCFARLLVDNTGDRSTRVTKIETAVQGKGFHYTSSKLTSSPESRIGAHDSASLGIAENLNKRLKDRELSLAFVVYHTHGKLKATGISTRLPDQGC